MDTCFVIQPFDSGKFDKRYSDIYKPAIEAAGLKAYRVDKDPGVSIPIDSIEAGIKSASICIADITVDNPNVWYELGFAFASGRPVVMICSDERTGRKYPFDIQHRTVIAYSPDSLCDFDELKNNITAKLKALIERGENLKNIAKSELIEPVEGLSPNEILVLAVIAGNCFLPDHPIGVWAAKNDAERAGITNVGFNLALRKLSSKEFLFFEEMYDESNSEPYEGVKITERGWEWIEKNETKFVLHRPNKEPDVPF